MRGIRHRLRRLRLCCSAGNAPGAIVIGARSVLATVLILWLLAAPAEARPARKVMVQLQPATIVADGASQSIATAYVTDATGSPVSGDAVTFSASDSRVSFSSVTDNANGTYTATLTSSRTAGEVTITATDTVGPSTFTGQTTLTQTPGPAAFVDVSLSPASIPADGASTSTATATVIDAYGNLVSGDNITFSASDSGIGFGAVSRNPNGTYTTTVTSSTTPGQVTITATDRSVVPSISGQNSLAQAAASPRPSTGGGVPTTGGGVPTSTTSLVASPNAPVTNQTVSLVATVTSSAGSAPPSGTLMFENRGVPISGCASKPVTPSYQSMTVTCQTSFAASSSPASLSAVFTPSPGYSLAGSASPIASVAIARDSTTAVLNVSSPTLRLGGSVTYIATVTPRYGGRVTPAGLVEFLDAGAPIASCARQPLVSFAGAGTATCTVSYNATGSHGITALYLGDGNFGLSSSPPQMVNALALGTINSTMQWTFHYTPAYTNVLALVINKAPAGVSIRLACKGLGCPFANRRIPVRRRPRRGARRINLTHQFATHHLYVGTQITVAIVRRGWNGKYYRFTIRAGRSPGIEIGCLPPGATRPGAGC